MAQPRRTSAKKQPAKKKSTSARATPAPRRKAGTNQNDGQAPETGTPSSPSSLSREAQAQLRRKLTAKYH